MLERSVLSPCMAEFMKVMNPMYYLDWWLSEMEAASCPEVQHESNKRDQGKMEQMA